MQVRNLVSWAGDNFSFVPGDVVELDDETAAARVAAGLAEEITPLAVEVKRGPGRPPKVESV